jgi:hypothetical protein
MTLLQPSYETTPTVPIAAHVEPIEQVEPPKTFHLSAAWACVLNHLQRARNAGDRFVIVDLRTLEVGTVAEMERGGHNK